MHRFTKYFACLALTTLSSLSIAASPSNGVTENDAAHAVGIITPSVASSAIVFDNHIRFKDTGEFAVCADGKDKVRCEEGKYLTPEQFISQHYPKARYVGFRLLMSSRDGSDTYLYVYIKSMK